MLTYIRGDIFDSHMQTLVNPVNTVGVMGAGLAKEFAKRYPTMFCYYRDLCDTQELSIGWPWIYKEFNSSILLFPTKRHWKDPSKLEYIDSGLRGFVLMYKEMNIASVAFPKLGCGLGVLWWPSVEKLFEKHLAEIDISVEIYI